MVPASPRTASSSTPFAVALLLAACTLFVFAGCRERNVAPPDAAGSQAADAEAVLRRMVDRYRRASAYADNGFLRLRYREQGRFVVDETPMSLRVQRPNRLRLRAYAVTAISDGQRLFARIEDKATSDLGGQVLVRRAPENLSLADLYRDTVLRDALVNGLGRQPTPLELCYAEQPLQAVFAPAVRKRLLPPGELEGHRCLRVEAATPEGAFVFWVDEDEYLLRRLEYPVAALLPELAASAAAGEAELVAEFSNARFNTPLDDRSFVFPLPSSARQVRGFVLPPQPLPSSLFGKQPADFSLATADGTRLGRDALRGKIVALVWFQDYPACRGTLEQLSRVRQTLSETERVAFYAVSAEAVSRSHPELEKLLSTWKVELPVLRDLDACGRDVFQIPGMPTLILLDATGTVQVFEVVRTPI